MKRFLKRALFVLLALVIVIQFVPVERDNPPVTAGIAATNTPPEVLAILRRSCFDCHSNESVWPWYAYVAPVSWLVARDVEEGRAELNFSTWGEYDAVERASKASTAIEEIEEGKMPLPKYLRMHSEARLSPEDIDRLRRWADDIE